MEQVMTYTVKRNGHTACFRLHGFGEHVIETFNRTLASEYIKEAEQHDKIHNAREART